MNKDSPTRPVPDSSSLNTVNSKVNQKILKKYSVGHRVSHRITPYPINNSPQFNTTQESKITRNVANLSDLCKGILEMPPKIDCIIGDISKENNNHKLSSGTENAMMKNISKSSSKADNTSDTVVLKNILRPQGVPLPPDKVGIVREPQVIVRKFNIPIVCSSNNNSKFTKLKERWKYQHDVVGLTNVSPSNPLHTIMKAKSVLSYPISFVNEKKSIIGKQTIKNFPKTGKRTPITLLPKSHILSSNLLPSSSPSSNITVLPSSLPSTPTAVVKPVQTLPTQPSSTNLGESGKFVIIKTVDGSEKPSINTSGQCESTESEVISVNQTPTQMSITSPPKIAKPRTIIVQGSHMPSLMKETESQTSTKYLNPFAEVNEKIRQRSNSESVHMMDTSDASSSPEVMESDTNTIHLEILSGSKLPESRDVEMVDSSMNQGESMITITAPNVAESNAINNVGHGRSITISHHDNTKPLTFIAVPASGNGTISQLLLKSQSAPITVQTPTPAPRLVSATIGEHAAINNIITTNSQQIDGSVHSKKIQFTPMTLTNPITGLQQKLTGFDKPLLGQDALFSPTMLVKNPEKPKSEVLVLKSLQPQNVPFVPTMLPGPVIVTGLNDILKPMQLTNGSPSVTGSDSKSNNLALIASRQSIAMQYQRDMIKSQEETQVPRMISYPARSVEVIDSSTQTALFSMMEPGRLVEITYSADAKGTKSGPPVVMPSQTMQLTTSTSLGKPSTSMQPLLPGKRIVSVDSNGRVMTIGGGSSTEPLSKKLKLEQTEPSSGNIFRLLCSPTDSKPSKADSSVCQNINQQTVKNINDLMYDNIIQQHNAAFDKNSMEPKGSLNCSKLELDGVEAMVVDPSDILPNSIENINKPIVPQINKKFLLQSAYKDWTNCLVPDEDGNVPLHNAVCDEDLNKVKRQCLVLEARKESIDIRNAERQTPLHLAVWLGCPQIVLTLLKFKAQPNIMDFKGNNALHLAIEETSNIACLEILLNECNCKPFIDNMNYDGFSPLHLCAITGKCEESVALIKKGANINLRDGKSGRTALFHAVETRNSDLSRLLVQYGASASVCNYAGQTPLLATNDMSMLGERAMASVIMSRNSLLRSKEKAEAQAAAVLAVVDQPWKILEQDDR